MNAKNKQKVSTSAELNLGVWLISLPESEDRRAGTVANLEATGLPFKVFDAINGAAQAEELASRVNADAYQRNMGTSLPPGKMGVYASHLAVWQEFLSTGHDYALVLEDDVVLHDDFMPALQTALSVESLWDIIRFNCIRAKLPVTQARVGDYRVNAYLGPFTGNATYLINRETAEKLSTQLWPQQRALDHELNRYFVHDYRQLGLEPWSSHPDDEGVSTITGTNHSLLKKPHWSKRLPYYRQKSSNYFRRFFWLLRKGMLNPLIKGPVRVKL